MSERIDLAALAILARDWSAPSVTGEELATLVAVARAALVLDVPVLIRFAERRVVYCHHCKGQGYGEPGEAGHEPVWHEARCSGIALRDALAGITEGDNE